MRLSKLFIVLGITLGASYSFMYAADAACPKSAAISPQAREVLERALSIQKWAQQLVDTNPHKESHKTALVLANIVVASVKEELKRKKLIS